MKKFICIILMTVFCISLVGCGGGKDSSNENSSSVEIVFFDIENSSDGKIHYDGEKNDGSLGYSGIKPADCFLIKTGDIEILVDGGFQSQGGLEVYSKRVAKVYQENVIKKIEKYCTDGVLEYLVVTHGDFDHIIGLAVDDGLLDYFLKNENKTIRNIIDFDSDLVVYLSNPDGNDIYPSGYNNFFDSLSVIDLYRQKRDALVEKEKTNHLPASAFFKGNEISQDNTFVNAMPSEYLDKYYTVNKDGSLNEEQINTSYLTNFYYFSDNVIIHNQCNAETKESQSANVKFNSSYKKLKVDLGELKNENERYYYSIKLINGIELRILYNWYYDHFYKHSFKSQDRNNISICFEIVTGSEKFLSFGDLGSGESGLIRYYKDTDILSDISCFKASHHGSTTNQENSLELYKLLNTDIVVVPGVAQINRDILGANNMTSDPIFIGLSGTAVMKNEFFTNVLTANQNTKIFCTQITKLLDPSVSGTKFSLISAPLYGDIFISMDGTNTRVDCSYKGKVEGYVSSYKDNLKSYTFSNQQEGKLLSFNETDYWKEIYKNGGK